MKLSRAWLGQSREYLSVTENRALRNMRQARTGRAFMVMARTTCSFRDKPREDILSGMEGASVRGVLWPVSVGVAKGFGASAEVERETKMRLKVIVDFRGAETARAESLSAEQRVCTTALVMTPRGSRRRNSKLQATRSWRKVRREFDVLPRVTQSVRTPAKDRACRGN